VFHGGDVRAQGAAADRIEGSPQRFGGHDPGNRHQRRQGALPVRLAERDEPDPGRDEVGGESVEVEILVFYCPS